MTLDSEKIASTVRQEYKILAEYKMFQTEFQVSSGIYVIPSAESSFLWFGVIFVRRGLYKDGIFRFTISLPESFPNTNDVPKVIFQSEIFHPSICPFTGTLDASSAFPAWNGAQDHLWQLAKYVVYILECPDQGQVVHPEAAELLTQNRSEFSAKVRECVRVSRDKVYDPPSFNDKHYITFDHFDAELHGPLLSTMKSEKVDPLASLPFKSN